MSNIVPYQSAIQEAQKKFVEIATKADTGVLFEMESLFALQAFSKNKFLADTANGNLNSLRNAIINVASVGLSLNPVMQYAYLVPRDGQVCLDVSYKGLLKLATDSGSILWGRAELVYEKDVFNYKGPAQIPDHNADVFCEDRGKFVGVYCIAKTVEGDFLIDIMNAKEIDQIQQSSKTTKADTPWKKWFGEMAKKSIIKRASKTWPRSDKNDRLAQAIQLVNEHEGIDFDVDQQGPIKVTAAQLDQLEASAKERGVQITPIVEGEITAFMQYVKKVCGVDALSDIQADKFPIILAAVMAKPVLP